jgi:hypothetical protein
MSGPKHYVHESIFSQIEVLRRQILAAQIAGLLLIIVPAVWIGHQSKEYALLAFPVAGVTALYFALIYRDRLQRRRILSFAERIQRYRAHLGWLIGVDAVFCLGLIGLSGGFPDSHLSFVFLLIPASVGFIRSGGTTLRTTVLVVIVIIVLECTWHFPSTPIGHFFALFGLVPFDSQQSPNYPFVVAFGLIVGVLLTWYQSFVVAGSSLPDRIMSATVDTLRNAGVEREILEALTDRVSKAYHHMSRTISLTNEPDMHCSVVHPLEDVVFQAYALAMPPKTLCADVGVGMQAAAEVTFAAHWLDDAFDCLGYDRLTEDETHARPFNIETIDTNGLAEYYHPYGIRRIMLEIKARTRWAQGSEIGLMRIVCGGFIQSFAGRHRIAAAARIRNDTRSALIDGSLSNAIRQANIAFLWGITKSDMPLVLSMYLTGDAHLHGAGLVLDALFMPLLVWHDLETEILRESVSEEGFEGHGIRQELEAAAALAVKCISIGRETGLNREAPVKAMRPVLELAFRQYSNRVPKGGNYDDYLEAIAAFLQDQ